MINDVKMGLDRPKSTDKQMEIYRDLREMRKAITHGQRDSTLINACLRMAEANGLSSEELYLCMAYHALCQLEEFWRDRVKLAMLDPRRPPMSPESEEASHE